MPRDRPVPPPGQPAQKTPKISLRFRATHQKHHISIFWCTRGVGALECLPLSSTPPTYSPGQSAHCPLQPQRPPPIVPLTAPISIFVKRAIDPPHRHCRPRLLENVGDPSCLASCLFVPFALPCQCTCPRLPSSCCMNLPFCYLRHCVLIKAALSL